jgi:hypothetical protein
LGLALLLVGSQAAWAHKGSDAYLTLGESPGVTLRLAVALKDLDLLTVIDADGDARITWGEVKRAEAAILGLIDSHVELLAGGDGGAAAADCALPRRPWRFAGLEAKSDGVYVRAVAALPCSPAGGVALRYRLLEKEDATHRLLIAGHVDGEDLLLTASPDGRRMIPLLRARRAPLIAAAPAEPHGAVEVAGTGTGTEAVAGAVPLAGAVRVAPAGRAVAAELPAQWTTLVEYFSLGVHHLLEGYDHLAFLLALVLPLSLRVALGRGAAPAGLRREWRALARIITAFTVGHSITLALAALGYVHASPAWVEPAIAVSIGATALLNLYPRQGIDAAALAGVFGLVHGLGFSGLLSEAAAPSGLLAWALAGFNLGIEAAQVGVVAAWVLVMQPFYERRWFASHVRQGGSWALLGLSAWWFYLRV